MWPIVVAVMVLSMGVLLAVRIWIARKRRRRFALVQRMLAGLQPPPHPVHPVFGALRGWGNDWDFDTALPCSGLNVAQVTIHGEGKPSDGHVRNLERIRQQWAEIWPTIFAALREKVTDYGYEDSFTEAQPKLSVTLPEESIDSGASWGVNIGFEPFAGFYGVDLRGWREIEDTWATF
jgi:hypothetical protein